MRVKDVISACDWYLGGIGDVCQTKSAGRFAAGVGKLVSYVFVLPLIFALCANAYCKKFQASYDQIDKELSKKTDQVYRTTIGDKQFNDYLLDKLEGISERSGEDFELFQKGFRSLTDEGQEKFFTKVINKEILDKTMMYIPRDIPTLRFKLPESNFAEIAVARNQDIAEKILDHLSEFTALKHIVLDLSGLGHLGEKFERWLEVLGPVNDKTNEGVYPQQIAPRGRYSVALMDYDGYSAYGGMGKAIVELRHLRSKNHDLHFSITFADAAYTKDPNPPGWVFFSDKGPKLMKALRLE